MKPFLCRPLAPEDTEPLLELLRRIHPTLARLSSQTAYRAIVKECLRSRRLCCFVAVRQNELIGYVIAARDWRRFQRAFLCRHPLLALTIVARKFQWRSAVRPSESPARRPCECALPGTRLAEGRKWEDNGKAIAKIIHVGTDGAERCKGVGSALYDALRRHLAEQGVTRIDAKIEAGNQASVRLHERCGWTLRACPGGFFATTDLSKQRYERTAPGQS